MSKFSIINFICIPKIYIGIFFLLNSLNVLSQIPQKAITIADSICNTRLYCSNTVIQLKDSIFYPKEKTKYQDRQTQIYFFTYKIELRDTIETELNISIKEDFSIKYISGFPDKSYNFSSCEIIATQKLWELAKKQGLKTKYKKCRYYLSFEDNGIFVRFHENKSKWYVDYYLINVSST